MSRGREEKKREREQERREKKECVRERKWRVGERDYMRADANSSARPTTRERARVRKSVIEHGYHKRRSVRPASSREAVCFHAVEGEGDEDRITGKDYSRTVVCDEKTTYCNALDDGEKLSRLL